MMCCLIGVVQLAPPVADACELSNSQAKQIGFVQLLPPVAGVCDLSNSLVAIWVVAVERCRAVASCCLLWHVTELSNWHNSWSCRTRETRGLVELSNWHNSCTLVQLSNLLTMTRSLVDLLWCAITMV